MNIYSNNKKLLLIIVIFAVGSLILYSNKKALVFNPPHVMSDLIRKQFLLYPEMKIQDLYKFIHQAALGSEHAVKDFAAAKRWMDEELAKMNTSNHNELCDTLSPGGKLVRVNLRPFRKLNYNHELLVDAFVKTSNIFKGSIDTLKYFWSLAINLADKGSIPLKKSEMISFFKEKEAQGFPAVHHSELYNKLYHPAYRVVAKDYLDFLNHR